MTEPLGLTPSQTMGPYGSIGLLRDLVPAVLVDPGDPRAVRIRGPLLDGAGDGVPDGDGRDLAGGRRPAGYGTSATFPGFGRSGTDDDGRFEFVTVKPGPRAVARRRPAGAAHRRRRLRARPPEAGRDAALLPGRGGGERGRTPCSPALPPTQRETLVAVRGGRRPPLRHPLAGARANDILRGVTAVRRPVRPRRAPRGRLGPVVARGDAGRRERALAPPRAPRVGVVPAASAAGSPMHAPAGRVRLGRAARPRVMRSGTPSSRSSARCALASETSASGACTSARRARTSSTPPRCSSLENPSRTSSSDVDASGRALRGPRPRAPCHADGRRGRSSSRRCRRPSGSWRPAGSSGSLDARRACATSSRPASRRSSAARQGRSPRSGERRHADRRRSSRAELDLRRADASVAHEPRARSPSSERRSGSSPACCGKIALDLVAPRADRSRRGAREARADGSSTMPQKRNPVRRDPGASRAPRLARVRTHPSSRARSSRSTSGRRGLAGRVGGALAARSRSPAGGRRGRRRHWTGSRSTRTGCGRTSTRAAALIVAERVAFAPRGATSAAVRRTRSSRRAAGAPGFRRGARRRSAGQPADRRRARQRARPARLPRLGRRPRRPGARPPRRRGRSAG